jgi:hypothetical protein
MTIDSLQTQAKLVYDQELARRNIKQQMESRLTVNHNGGVFSVTKEQINFLDLLGNQEVVLLDDYETPIKCDAFELMKLMFARYHEVMNEWLLAYEEQVKIRSVKNV